MADEKKATDAFDELRRASVALFAEVHEDVAEDVASKIDAACNNYERVKAERDNYKVEVDECRAVMAEIVRILLYRLNSRRMARRPAPGSAL